MGHVQMIIRSQVIIRRSFSTEITPLIRIGKAVTSISEEYKSFFNKPPPSKEFYSPNLKFILHLDSTAVADPQNDKVLQLNGREEIFSILERMKMLMKWGHFYWRLSDLSALKLDPIRVVRPPSASASEPRVEMKIYWQLKIEGRSVVFIDGKEREMSMKSLIQVQLQRFRLLDSAASASNTNTILYSGITRYVFDTQSGVCTEMHVERVEPKISGIDWKWRMSKVKFSEA